MSARKSAFAFVGRIELTITFVPKKRNGHMETHPWLLTTRLTRRGKRIGTYHSIMFKTEEAAKSYARRWGGSVIFPRYTVRVITGEVLADCPTLGAALAAYRLLKGPKPDPTLWGPEIPYTRQTSPGVYRALFRNGDEPTTLAWAPPTIPAVSK